MSKKLAGDSLHSQTVLKTSAGMRLQRRVSMLWGKSTQRRGKNNLAPNSAFIHCAVQTAKLLDSVAYRLSLYSAKNHKVRLNETDKLRGSSSAVARLCLLLSKSTELAARPDWRRAARHSHQSGHQQHLQSKPGTRRSS